MLPNWSGKLLNVMTVSAGGELSHCLLNLLRLHRHRFQLLKILFHLLLLLVHFRFLFARSGSGSGGFREPNQIRGGSFAGVAGSSSRPIASSSDNSLRAGNLNGNGPVLVCMQLSISSTLDQTPTTELHPLSYMTTCPARSICLE